MAQPLAVALHALRRADVRPGQVCVVLGVGGIGSFILGAAAARGISPLIAVDIDERFERRNSRCGDRDRRNLADIVLDRVIALADLVDGGIRPLAERTARGKIIVDTQPA